MRIGIEGQRLFRPNKHGMDMVALELIRNLQALDKDNEYVIFVSPDTDNQVIQETDNFKIVVLKGLAYPIWEQILLPRAAKRYGCELLHCTSNTAPIRSTVPIMITLHDIIYMEKSIWKILLGSGSAYQKFGNIYRKWVVPKVLKQSKSIITVSNFEKTRISEFFKLESNATLRAVYNGVSAHFKPLDEIQTAAIRIKYSLPENYCFFLGNLDPKKNTPNTLKAFALFVKRSSTKPKLVMIDFKPADLEKILQEIDEPELLQHMHILGYVPNVDLPGIYQLSQFFLYTSLRESFGIPMLEAMACGTPVITSDSSSMPEIAGDAAILVDPNDVESMAEAMLCLTLDDAMKNQHIEKGLIRAKDFSWMTMAKKVFAIYQEILGDNKQSI